MQYCRRFFPQLDLFCSTYTMHLFYIFHGGFERLKWQYLKLFCEWPLLLLCVTTCISVGKLIFNSLLVVELLIYCWKKIFIWQNKNQLSIYMVLEKENPLEKTSRESCPRKIVPRKIASGKISLLVFLVVYIIFQV